MFFLSLTFCALVHVQVNPFFDVDIKHVRVDAWATAARAVQQKVPLSKGLGQ